MAAGLSAMMVPGCSDKKIVQSVCDSCYRYQVDFPGSGTDSILRDVYFVDGENGWIAGHDGLVLHSSDGGATWTRQHEAAGQRLWSAYFLSPSLGWVVNELDTLLHTDDGGANWTAQRVGAGRGLTSIYVYDQDHAWIVGDSVIARKDSYGNWEVYNDIYHYVSTMYGVAFVTPLRGWAVGSGERKILSTDDGGLTWIYQPNPATQPLLDLKFVDASHGWAVGVGGTIVRTVDGGLTWTRQDIGTSRVLHGVDFWDVNTGVVVGDSGTIYTTSNGGVTWDERASGTPDDLLKVSYVTADKFCACGYHGALLLVTRQWEECCE